MYSMYQPRKCHMFDFTLILISKAHEICFNNLFFQVFRGTITDAPDFNPSADAEALYNAMKGIGKCVYNSWQARFQIRCQSVVSQ